MAPRQGAGEWRSQFLESGLMGAKPVSFVLCLSDSCEVPASQGLRAGPHFIPLVSLRVWLGAERTETQPPPKHRYIEG